jgi:hypothetical protein
MKQETKKYKSKKKLSALAQVDGKVAGGGEFKGLSSLIASEASSHPYHCSTEEEYVTFIDSLNSTDLHRHAERVGLVPTVERRVLKDRLTREFRRFLAARSPASSEMVFAHMNRDASGSSLSSAAQKILREGC